MPLDKPFHLYLLCIYTMKQYNFYNLEASFIRFLNSGNRSLSIVTIKNYISDLRHFFGWFIFRLKASQDYSHYVEKLDLPALITRCLDKLIVAQYRSYLIENKIPLQTANRRLSTLRKLSMFFISQRWINENPTLNLRNITNKIEKDKNKDYIQTDTSGLIINEYKKALESQNLNIQGIKRYLDDVNEFISFT